MTRILSANVILLLNEVSPFQLIWYYLAHFILFHNAHLVHLDERLRHKEDVVRSGRGDITFVVVGRGNETTDDGREDDDEEPNAELHPPATTRREAGREGGTRSFWLISSSSFDLSTESRTTGSASGFTFHLSGFGANENEAWLAAYLPTKTSPVVCTIPTELRTYMYRLLH